MYSMDIKNLSLAQAVGGALLLTTASYLISPSIREKINSISDGFFRFIATSLLSETTRRSLVNRVTEFLSCPNQLKKTQEDQLKKTQEELNSLTQEEQQLRAQIEEVRQKIANCQTQQTAQEDKQKAQITKRQKLTSQQNELKDQKNVLDVQFTSLKDAEEQQKRLELEISAYATKKADLQNRIKDLRKDLENLRLEFEAQKASLQFYNSQRTT